jgi:hypothetical protein
MTVADLLTELQGYPPGLHVMVLPSEGMAPLRSVAVKALSFTADGLQYSDPADLDPDARTIEALFLE